MYNNIYDISNIWHIQIRTQRSPLALFILFDLSTDLDIDWIDSCWFITTALLAVVIPSLFFVIHFL
jgi:hypothetical protein